MAQRTHGMRSARCTALILLLVGACGGDDNGTGGGTAGASSGPGGSGGSSTGAGGAAGVKDSSADQSTTQGDAGADAGNTADASDAANAHDAADARELGPVSCSSLPDGGADAGAMAVAPGTLAETGLYCDFAAKIISPTVRSFRPRFELWSDGADKSRWVQIPSGAKIDVSDPDHWVVPIGTRFWKEFRYLGKRVETRLIVRYGAGKSDFLYAAYRWNAEETAAEFVPPEGKLDVAPIEQGAEPLMHDIPSRAECINCHGKLSEAILGFSAIQLSHDFGGETISTLLQSNVLVGADGGAPNVPSGGYHVPGDELDQKALGYLHANCGNCHTDQGPGATPKYRVRLLTTNTTVESTLVYQTAVNQLHTLVSVPPDAGVGPYRIQGHAADASELYLRTGSRAPAFQMPPVDTKIIDPEGRAILKQWIDRLPPPPEGGTPDGGDAAAE
ncbi:MAG TPA: hypothetical protein VJT73_11750 [Polyangiaceae bacterium]|nr:hypothetical protein [Polyangiaceae bacterium]